MWENYIWRDVRKRYRKEEKKKEWLFRELKFSLIYKWYIYKIELCK